MNAVRLENPAVEKGFLANWPGKIIFGAGKLDAVGEEAKALGGRRVFLVTTKDLLQLGVVERVQRILRNAGLEVRCFDDVQPDPSCEAVDQAAMEWTLTFRNARERPTVILEKISAVDTEWELTGSSRLRHSSRTLSCKLSR